MRFITQKNRAILREMVVTDFKVRYQGSVLGYAWSVLRPLFIFAILYIVFVKFLKIGSDIPNFPVYLLFGIILWNFFSEATNNAMTAVVARGDLIKKINIPRYLVVVSGTFSAYINFLLNMLVLLLIAFISGVRPMSSWLLLPFLFVELFVLSISIGFLLSALFVKYRDAIYVWEVFLQAGFYATPILYPLSMVAIKFQPIIMLNPMAQIIQDSRWALISHETLSSWKVLDLPELIIPLVFIVVLLILSVLYFKKESKYFAERL